MLESYEDIIATRQVFIVEDGEEIIGVLVLSDDADDFLLENVAVDPRYQGKGLGKALLQLAEVEARSRGLSEIHLYTNVVMAENLRLYFNVGYAEYARREENGFARIYMKKVLS